MVAAIAVVPSASANTTPRRNTEGWIGFDMTGALMSNTATCGVEESTAARVIASIACGVISAGSTSQSRLAHEPFRNRQRRRATRESCQCRRLSQLDLSVDAERSTRHLSFVETGRTMPGRALVLATPAGTRLFCSTTAFGTPADITLSELALETLFPADAATAQSLRAALGG